MAACTCGSVVRRNFTAVVVAVAVLLFSCAQFAQAQRRRGFKGESGVSAGWVAGVVISIIAIIFGLVCLIIGICYCRYAMKGKQFSLWPSRNSGAKKYAEPITHLHDGMEIGLPSPLDAAPNTFRFNTTPGGDPVYQGHTGIPDPQETRFQSYDSPYSGEEGGGTSSFECGKAMPSASLSHIQNPKLQAGLDTDVNYTRSMEYPHSRNDSRSVSSDEEESPRMGYSHRVHDITSDDIISDDAASDDVITEGARANVHEDVDRRPPYTVRTMSGSSATSENMQQTAMSDAQGGRQSWTLFAKEYFERGDALPKSLKPDGLYTIGDGVSLDGV